MEPAAAARADLERLDPSRAVVPQPERDPAAAKLALGRVEIERRQRDAPGASPGERGRVGEARARGAIHGELELDLAHGRWRNTGPAGVLSVCGAPTDS